MRTTNWRLVITGLVMIILAIGFFIGMGAMAGRSNDPATMMQTVGQVSGIGLVMAIFGFIGQRRA